MGTGVLGPHVYDHGVLASLLEDGLSGWDERLAHAVFVILLGGGVNVSGIVGGWGIKKEAPLGVSEASLRLRPAFYIPAGFSAGPSRP